MGSPDPGSSVAIRPAVGEDADAVGAIGGRSWDATYRGIVPDEVLDDPIAQSAAGWTAAIAPTPPDSPSRAWVAVDDLRGRGFDPLVVPAFRDDRRALDFSERVRLVVDLNDATRELGGVSCPIVRFVRSGTAAG